MIKKAVLKDAESIYKLINSFADKRLMLSRSLNYVYEKIREFWVYKQKGRVIGCSSLNVVGWQDLAEIKSLAVDKKYQRKGIGGLLVKACLKEAKTLGVERVFVLTYKPAFFRRLGFNAIKKEKLPHKIWSDCLNCSEFPECKEEALIKRIK